MNKVDCQNMKNLLEWRELARIVNKGARYEKGGELKFDFLVELTDERLKEEIQSFEDKEKNESSKELKKKVDEFFEKYGTENSNMIVLSGAYYPSDPDSRRVYEREDIINDIAWDGFGRKYNKLYYPCAVEKLPAGDWYSTHELPKEERESIRRQWNKYYDDIAPLYKLAYDFGIPNAEEYYENDNSALNDCWYGVIGIMKDYRVVAFVIRNDGMLCDEDSYESYHNSVIAYL